MQHEACDLQTRQNRCCCAAAQQATRTHPRGAVQAVQLPAVQNLQRRVRAIAVG